MDAVAFAKAAKQEQRIKKVIAEPDSVAGLVSVPNLVPTGETITIPAGRTVVHPNLQVDGTLTVDGTLFIPSGSTYTATEVDATVVKQNGSVVADDSTVVHKTGDETIAGVKTLSNNLVFASGTKIQGDFSNEAINNRVAFQTSVLNGNSSFQFIPNGMSQVALAQFNTSEDIVNCSSLHVGVDGVIARIHSFGNGVSGAGLPLSFATNRTERLRIDTSGNVLVTGSGGLGYGTGSGGTVTQLTSKSTAVTLNKPCGQITTNNSVLTSGAIAQFVFNNSIISATDKVDVWVLGGTGNLQNYRVWASPFSTSGLCYVEVKNESAGSLSEALILGFYVAKGVIA